MASAILLYLLGRLVYGVFWGELQAADLRFHRELAPWRTSEGMWLARAVSVLADLGVVGAAAGVALLVALASPARRERGLTLFIALAGGLGIIMGTKALLGRARPDTPITTIGAAFPSGHAFFALCLYGIVAHLLARRARLRRAKVAIWLGAALIIAAVGASRVYLGAHWLTDVAAGYLVAVPWVLGLVAARDWVLGRRRGPTQKEIGRAEALLRRASTSLPAAARLARALLKDPEVRWPQRAAPLALALALSLPFERLPHWVPLVREADRMAAAAPFLALSIRWLGCRRVRSHWDGSVDVLYPIGRIRHAIRLLLGRRRIGPVTE
jgi:undecaprenyl-diphosphatase